MDILFIHPNMPGQFKHLCRAYGASGEHRVVFITKPRPKVDIPSVMKMEYRPAREPSPRTHRYIISLERGVLNGQEVWRMCQKMKQEGFVPDIIVAHPGWGDALYVKDVYPDAPLLNYFEFYYCAHGGDVNFDPDDPMRLDDLARIRTKNALNLFNLEASDWGISPTFWQRNLHPKEFQDRISVIHDGVDTSVVAPDPNASFTLQDGTRLTANDEVVTYVARNFEPYRGFPTAMQAFKKIQERRPNAHIIAIGADEISYGKPPPRGTTYRRMWTEKVQPDLSRLHFVGYVAYDAYLKALQISSAHIYLTYPFVLSWSALEAMAAECLLISSRTAPVEEVIQDGRNGLLVDFFSPEEVADRVCEALEHPERFADIRKTARQDIVNEYELSRLMPLQMQLIDDLANKRFPPPAAEQIAALYVKSHEEAA